MSHFRTVLTQRFWLFVVIHERPLSAISGHSRVAVFRQKRKTCTKNKSVPFFPIPSFLLGVFVGRVDE